MTTTDSELAALFLAFSRNKLFGQYWPRLKACVEPMTVEQVWWRPNEASNSVGNLLLHLNGNVTQWLVWASPLPRLRRFSTASPLRNFSHPTRFRAITCADSTLFTKSSSTSAFTTARSLTSPKALTAKISASIASSTRQAALSGLSVLHWVGVIAAKPGSTSANSYRSRSGTSHPASASARRPR